MSKPLFNAKINLSSSVEQAPGEYEVTFNLIDNEGVFSGLDVQAGDELRLDTSAVELATITRYSVLSVATATFTEVTAVVTFDDDNDAPIDPAVAIGVDGFIARPTVVRKLSVVPAFGVQLLPDKFAVYPQNTNFRELDQSAVGPTGATGATGEIGPTGPTGPAGPGAVAVVETRAVTSAESLAKSLTLSATPIDASAVIFEVDGAPPQFWGYDYTVTGNTLSWAGLGLDGLIDAGDIIRVQY